MSIKDKAMRLVVRIRGVRKEAETIAEELEAMMAYSTADFFRGIAYRLEDAAQAIERHILKTRPQIGY